MSALAQTPAGSIAAHWPNLFQEARLSQAGESRQRAFSGQATATAAYDFSATFRLQWAALQEQSFATLLGGAPAAAPGNLDLFSLFDPRVLADAPADALSPTGRNLSLFDPESAYRMMSLINQREVAYKAQFAELGEMKTALGGLQQAVEPLTGLDLTADDATVSGRVNAFIGKYNAWIERFDDTVDNGGILDGTQAAEFSLQALEQSIGNIFVGAGSGFRGLRDLGIEIDQTTHLATFDSKRLNSAITRNHEGVITTLHEFGSHFARSAELLISENNLIPNRLANLNRVIDYLGENLPALQQEFGLGDPVRTPAQTARALHAYQSQSAL